MISRNIKYFCLRMSENPNLDPCQPNLEDRGICAVDPCKAEKCFPEPRVVIIGAGMAGISAAARLSQRGIDNIVVLEAYERSKIYEYNHTTI